jgi:glyoxylase-like metal-dependent hydrolase (beta-lactamase superfamily II)
MTQVKEGIHRLTQGVVNFNLIEEDGRLLLVDTGAPGDWDLLVRAVADLGRGLDDLEAVLLTHAHPDHIGTTERHRPPGPDPGSGRMVPRTRVGRSASAQRHPPGEGARRLA